MWGGQSWSWIGLPSRNCSYRSAHPLQIIRTATITQLPPPCWIMTKSFQVSQALLPSPIAVDRHTHTTVTRVSWYQKEHSPTHTYCGHQSLLIYFLHVLRSTASSLFNLRALCLTVFFHNLQVLFGLPFGLAPSTSCSTYFFTQSLSSFRRNAHTFVWAYACKNKLYLHLL